MGIFTAKMFFSHFALVVDFPLLIKESVQLLHGSFALLNGMENQPEFYEFRYEFFLFFFFLIYHGFPFTSWKIDGETGETVADFIFLGSKITADGDCSHEIKRHLLLGRKVMTKLDSILKSRDITLSTKVCLVKSMVFQVVLYG